MAVDGAEVGKDVGMSDGVIELVGMSDGAGLGAMDVDGCKLVLGLTDVVGSAEGGAEGGTDGGTDGSFVGLFDGLEVDGEPDGFMVVVGT